MSTTLRTFADQCPSILQGVQTGYLSYVGHAAAETHQKAKAIKTELEQEPDSKE